MRVRVTVLADETTDQEIEGLTRTFEGEDPATFGDEIAEWLSDTDGTDPQAALDEVED